jgi:hypothetical protein
MSFFYQKNEGKLPNESIQRVKELFEKFRNESFRREDLIQLDGDPNSCPADLMQKVNKIDSLDCFIYKDGIDTEGLSYTYNNILHQFRYNFAVEIKVQAELVQMQGEAHSEANFAALLKKSGYDPQKYMTADLFEPIFDFNNVLGEALLIQV